MAKTKNPQRVEQHIIKDDRFKEVCIKSKELYNQSLYYLRQCLFGNIQWFKAYELSGLFGEFDEPTYRNLPIQSSQQVIKQVFSPDSYRDWKSWVKSLKDWKKHPHKYKSRPRIPLPIAIGNKKELSIAIFTNQNARLKNGFIHFPKSLNIEPIKTKQDKFQQVRIIPKSNHFVLEVVYNAPKVELKEDNGRYLGIDLGVNNLATCASNVAPAFIINGKPLKSINQHWNKKKAFLQRFLPNNTFTSKRIDHLTNRRNWKIKDYLHKTSREIIDYCIDNNITRIAVGKNKGWKQSISIGKKNNQQFVNIPFATFIEQLKYKAEDVGILVKENEESYTSKCSALDLESVQKQESYVGKRIKRGLFKTSTGLLINADVNGAINILRKVHGDAVMPAVQRFVLNPIRINII